MWEVSRKRDPRLSIVMDPGAGAGRAMARLDERLAAAATELKDIRSEIAALARQASAMESAAPRPITPRLLTVAQAAAALGLGESTVHGLIRSGKLHSRLIGTSRRVAVDDLDDFVNGLAVASGGP